MSFSIKSFVRSFKNVDILNDYFASVPVDIEIIEGLSEDERVNFIVEKFNDLSLHRQNEIISDLSEVDRCADNSIAIQTLEDITKARNAQWSKLTKSLNLSNVEGKIREMIERIEMAANIVKTLDKSLTKPYFDNKYRLFEIDVLNTVKMIDGALSLLNSKKNLRSVLYRFKLKSVREYFYSHKETISALSSLNYGHSYKSNLLDIYINPSRYISKKQTKEDRILAEIMEIRKEIKTLSKENEEGVQGFRFDTDTAMLEIGNIKKSFLAAEDQSQLLRGISSDKSIKVWSIDQIVEAMSEKYDKKQFKLWQDFLRQTTRNIMVSLTSNGFKGKFIEYRNKTLIVHK